MLPPFLGALLLAGTLLAVVLGVPLLLWAWRTGRFVLRRRVERITGLAVAVYGMFWILGLALARTTVLSPGAELRFCGLDCHLHVSVDGVRTGADLGVTVRFSSNAVEAPEWPGRLRFRLRDDEGREFAPLNRVPDQPLEAGATLLHELRFPAEARPEGAVLIVTWAPGLDYLVPGSGNILVQRHRRLALPTGQGRGA